MKNVGDGNKSGAIDSDELETIDDDGDELEAINDDGDELGAIDGDGLKTIDDDGDELGVIDDEKLETIDDDGDEFILLLKHRVGNINVLFGHDKMSSKSAADSIFDVDSDELESVVKFSSTIFFGVSGFFPWNSSGLLSIATIGIQQHPYTIKVKNIFFFIIITSFIIQNIK